MKVKIKTWEQMEREYGLMESGSIDVPGGCSFTQGMEKGMPKDRIIDIEKINDKYKWGIWEITDGMIEGYEVESSQPIISLNPLFTYKYTSSFPSYDSASYFSALFCEPRKPTKRTRIKKRNYNLNY